ncbi:response regulator transcription factor [Amycolatopsis sp. Hca4]|uniref:response regulator transcription factor n=1 Tax=Amycolatopsis sp. Hca4 TaxID=2742131 RepID=UPI00159020A4|nr:response regulator transcription factor [Amycolatopsis sp. Hca4]QKV80628.1 response regulator transcription factor [Amycolatopsis sp. Hca4]
MRVLVVEDEGVSAATAEAELRNSVASEVVVVADPVEALRRLKRTCFDVVVVDMLYRPHSEDFERRRRLGEVGLTGTRLHLSGLAVLHVAAGTGTAAVLWTGGEANRRLHMLFAYEQLACRAMCPKDSAGRLVTAVRSAASGREYLDPVVRMHLPPRSTPSLRETFLHSGSRLAVWRAMALGLHDHSRIGKAVGISPGTVRRGVEDMRARLVRFDPGCSLEGPPTPELVRYASQNWHFFLDETVRELHP